EQRPRTPRGRRAPAAAPPPPPRRAPAPEGRGGGRPPREKPPRAPPPAGKIKHPTEPRGGERHRAETPDHHRVGDRHRHLREIGRSKRRREGKGRAQLGPQPIHRVHLVSFQKRKGPDRYRRGAPLPPVCP